MRHTGAEIIVQLLERQGITTIAGIPGGANLPLYDALYRSNIRHILSRHEQGAGFIAHGMARSTGQTAVCFATSGPGATNLITAIADAKLDSVPLVAITGQVPSSHIGTDAFQEVDTYGMTLPITKHNFLIRSAEELLTVIPEAFRIAGSGRPGPVVVDVPKDVQLQKTDVTRWPSPGVAEERADIDQEAIGQAAKMIHTAQRPVLYIGGGVMHSAAHSRLMALARKNSIPVVSTLMGLGCFPADDPLYLGMLGMHGERATNLVLREADLLITLGARFDDRATGKVAEFCPRAAVIHVDIDRAEIHKIRAADLGITGGISSFLKQLVPCIEKNSRQLWHERISQLKADYPSSAKSTAAPGHPINILRTIARLAGPQAIVATDVGQHQMWVAQAYPFYHPRTLLTSGGLGTMGFGLPAAIGAALANPDRTVICIAGDGSLLMNIQELATLADLNLNVKIIVMNNGHLGLVRQQQQMFYKENYIASRFTSRTDFATISKGFGINGFNVFAAENAHNTLSQALLEHGPCLVDIAIDPEVNVVPIVPPGAANHEMIGGM